MNNEKFFNTNSRQNKRYNLLRYKILIFLFATVLFISYAGCTSEISGDLLFDQKIDLLRNKFTNDISTRIKYDTKKNGYIVFISLCNKKEKAVVFHAKGKTPEKAFANAVKNTKDFVIKNKYKAYWVKADIVDDTWLVRKNEFEGYVFPYRSGYLREGIAFDKGFNYAFLEAELNSSNLINYDDDAIDINNTQVYMNGRGEKPLKELPQEYYFFTTIGFFCDEDNILYTLYNDAVNNGRREVDIADDKLIADHVTRTTEFLRRQVQENGQFVYGYFPIYDEVIPSYNNIRHAGPITCLINQYAKTGDTSLIPFIEKTLKYLEEITVIHDGLAYVFNTNQTEIELGANAVAIMAFVTYMEAFHSNRYEQLTLQLAEGILSLMDIKNGTYYHVLNYPDFSIKEEHRTIFYDGEATYALAMVYGFTKQNKYLEATKAAVENFIRNKEEYSGSHWVAYAVNEITKYYPDKRFLEFGLINADPALENNRSVYNHTHLELLMQTFELYDRIIKNYPDLDYLSSFNNKQLFNTIFFRTEHMLNYFFYPEVAMYFQNPAHITDAFFARTDNYRMRMDDQKHTIWGLDHFVENYEKLLMYRDKFSQ
jgi:hypothetical protein